MTLDRRKVLIYLRPDISASERFADAKIEAHHRGDRGDMSRTALLAGLALGKSIAACRRCWRRCWRKILNRKRCVRCWLRSLEIQPASSAPASAPAAAPAKAPGHPRRSARASPRVISPVRYRIKRYSRFALFGKLPRLALRLAGLLFALPGSPGKAERRDPGNSPACAVLSRATVCTVR